MPNSPSSVASATYLPHISTTTAMKEFSNREPTYIVGQSIRSESVTDRLSMASAMIHPGNFSRRLVTSDECSKEEVILVPVTVYDKLCTTARHTTFQEQMEQYYGQPMSEIIQNGPWGASENTWDD